ncbi:hypothetical protein KSP39_PZI016133 [Platanthera zijinensis]|uniref:Uncharacterized protein n=1 Tax=Platanthera zijinensis TaxID=2320716 RepID=A0AAP0B7C9_9ASPA
MFSSAALLPRTPNSSRRQMQVLLGEFFIAFLQSPCTASAGPLRRSPLQNLGGYGENLRNHHERDLHARSTHDLCLTAAVTTVAAPTACGFPPG